MPLHSPARRVRASGSGLWHQDQERGPVALLVKDAGGGPVPAPFDLEAWRHPAHLARSSAEWVSRRIGTEFHRWLHQDDKRIGLITREDFYVFVTRDFDFYSRQYERVLTASSGAFQPDSPLRFIRYNADLGNQNG